MATYEQCQDVLVDRLRTRQDVEEFCRSYRSGRVWTNPVWNSEREFVEKNIENILDEAERTGRLDRLGRFLGIKSDAEQQRLEKVSQGIFGSGEVFDATSRIVTMIGSAKNKIKVIDGYVDVKLLELLSAKNNGVVVSILTKSVSPAVLAAMRDFNEQYGGLEIRIPKKWNEFHDRFVIVDDVEYFHSGHSLKDLGKSLSRISRIHDEGEISKLQSQFQEAWRRATDALGSL